MTKNHFPRLRILVSAYYCRPYVGSESGVGWNCVKALAKHHDVWVITRGDERSGIESIPPDEVLPNVHFNYFELPEFLRRLGFGSRKRPTQLYYYVWQFCIYFIARNLHATHNFHLAHHVTLVKFWAPCFLAYLPIPLIWGPVGGGESAPLAFWGGFGWRGKLYECLRNVGRWIGEHDPFVRATARRAAITLATSKETLNRIRTLTPRSTVDILPAIAVTDKEVSEFDDIVRQRDAAPGPAPKRFVSIGRMLHWKGFHLGIRAFAKADIEDSEYWFIGDGPELDDLKALADELGISDKVRFIGRLSHAETLQALGQCLCLVHPSLHESGGGVCLEAMAAKCPVVALDLGGPAEHLANGRGILVSASGPEQSIDELAEAITRLSRNPALRKEIAEKAYARLLADYTWDEKARKYCAIYADVLQQRYRFQNPTHFVSHINNEHHTTNAD